MCRQLRAQRRLSFAASYLSACRSCPPIMPCEWRRETGGPTNRPQASQRGMNSSVRSAGTARQTARASVHAAHMIAIRDLPPCSRKTVCFPPFSAFFFPRAMRFGCVKVGRGFNALAARPQAQRGFPALVARPHRSPVLRPAQALCSAAGRESNSSNEAPHSRTRWVQYLAQMAVSGAALGPLLDGYHSAFGVLVSERDRARVCGYSPSRLARSRSDHAGVCVHL